VTDTTWTALAPITLDHQQKLLLEMIASSEQFGGQFQTSSEPGGSDTSEELDHLANIGLVEWEEIVANARRGGSYGTGRYVYQVSGLGNLWLTRCTPQTDDHDLPDEMCALFNSLDAPTQRRFTAWAALCNGMELHAEGSGDAARLATDAEEQGDTLNTGVITLGGWSLVPGEAKPSLAAVATTAGAREEEGD
jgi:hypothetical protein